DAAPERAPQGPETADDDRLEGEDELRRTARRVERGAQREERPRERRRGDGDRGRPRVHRTRTDADERGRVRVLRGRAHRAAELGALEEQLQAAENLDRGGQPDHTDQRDAQLVRDLPAVGGGGGGGGGGGADVGREDLEQEVLDDDRETERR